MSRQPTHTDAVFGDRVRVLRQAQGWSGRELARKAGVNVSTAHRIEHGESITLDLAVKLAGALGASITEMLTEPECLQCSDLPPPGFTCNACSREGIGPA